MTQLQVFNLAVLDHAGNVTAPLNMQSLQVW